jgi:phage shock protein C
MMTNMTNGSKPLVRPREGRLIAGVCSGLGEHFNVDPNLIRLIFALLTVFSLGLGALVYLAGWALIPEEGEKSSIAENFMKKGSGT